jgi:anhydro-N-acetylmuramic acid kinase
MHDALYVGLMSGTSVDAIDAALVSCGETIGILATHEQAMSAALRESIAALSRSGPDEIERLGRLDREMGALFARAVLTLLDRAGVQPAQVAAIGSHGQTVRHRPPSSGEAEGRAFTLQLGDPNTIAENTGITTIADFRRRDIAAGGEGAPLAPAFHAAAFALEGNNRAIVNIGGIANVSMLTGNTLHSGFDSGPGNTLLDQWIARHRGVDFDREGQWSAEGTPDPTLLERFLQHPFFGRRGPRSTGREDFNLEWLDHCLAGSQSLAPEDVQATLAELTAASIARAIESSGVGVDEVFLCGGGAHNSDLARRLQAAIGRAPVATTANLGIDPDWVEAATFAWLAHRSIEGMAGNAPAVTGASGPRVLGGIYPA